MKVVRAQSTPSPRLVRLADRVLAASAIWCVLLALYALALALVPPSSSRDAVLTVPPTAAAILLFAARRLPAPARILLAFNVVAIGLLAYVADVVAYRRLTVFTPPLSGRPGFDRRTRSEVLDSLRRLGVRAEPAVHAAILCGGLEGGRRFTLALDGAPIMPLSGIANSITVVCNEDGRYLIYRSDEHGFHNPPGLWSAQRLTWRCLATPSFRECARRRRRPRRPNPRAASEDAESRAGRRRAAGDARRAARVLARAEASGDTLVLLRE